MEQSVERKLTTILCADVHGYSRLMEQDEAAMLATLRAYRDAVERLIARHRGRVVNTAGDGLLADFPSVVEAVQCAIEIQQELAGRNRTLPVVRRMAFRIGINLGDVMVDRGDLYGEGVNVAARLEVLAEPGGILISRTVYDQVRNKLRVGFDFLGEQPVKNIAEPVPVFRVRTQGGAAPAKRGQVFEAKPEPRSDRAQDLYRFRRRAFRSGFVVIFLFVINFATSPGSWWFGWPAMFIGMFVAWDGLGVYFPALAGRDREERS